MYIKYTVNALLMEGIHSIDVSNACPFRGKYDTGFVWLSNDTLILLCVFGTGHHVSAFGWLRPLCETKLKCSTILA